MHVFAHLAPICMLSRCLLTKFLHRSSVGSLLRVHCWLGEGRMMLAALEMMGMKKKVWKERLSHRKRKVEEKGKGGRS